MHNTETSAAATYTVTIDPTNARSIIAAYATYGEASARYHREIAKLCNQGGTAYIYENGIQMRRQVVKTELPQADWHTTMIDGINYRVRFNDETGVTLSRIYSA